MKSVNTVKLIPRFYFMYYDNRLKDGLSTADMPIGQLLF